LQAKEAAELAERQRVEAENRARRERDDLATYWRERLFKAFETRIAALNQALAKQAIELQRHPGGARAEGFGFSFLGNEVEVRVAGVPLSLSKLEKDALVTGCLYGKGPNRYIVAHLLVLRDETHYGNAREVTLPVQAFIADPRNAVKNAPPGADYIVPGQAVVARNALALLFQRQYRNTMHTVRWEEKDFVLDAMVAEFLDFVVKTEGPAK